VATLAADPAQKATVEAITQALTSVGGLQNLAAWLEDVGAAAVPVGDGVGAVVLLRGTDVAATSSHYDQIRNLLVLASTGSDITLTTTDHDGVTITSVDLGDVGSGLAVLGLPAGTLGSGSHVKFAMARDADVVIVGIGDGVVERVLDTQAAESLAASDAYTPAAARAGSPSDVEAFVAIDGIVAWLEGHAPAGFDLEAYRTDYKPYLEHLAGAATSIVTTSTGTRSRIIITVK
jgi:hypothetical protein